MSKIFSDMGKFIATKLNEISEKVDASISNSTGTISKMENLVDKLEEQATSNHNYTFIKVDGLNKRIDKEAEIRTANDTIINTTISTNRTDFDTFKRDTNIQTLNDTTKSNHHKYLIDTNRAAATAALTTETTNRVLADTELTTDLDTERKRIDAILNLSTTDKNTFIELVTYINTLDIENDAELIKSITAIKTLLNVEIVNRNVALSNESTIRSTADTNLTNDLDTERKRIDAILNLSTTDKNTFVELVAYINALNVENDGDLVASIAALNTKIATNTINIGNNKTNITDVVSSTYNKSTADLKFLYRDDIAVSASRLSASRTIGMTGDVTTTATGFDGTKNISFNVTVKNDSHTHDTRYYTEAESNSLYLGKTAKAADSDKLDGHDSAYFAAAHSHPYLGTTAKAADSDKLDGHDSSYFAAAHTHPYLGTTAKAADSDKLDGHDSSYFATTHTHPYLSNSHDLTIGLIGDVSGSTIFTNMANNTINVTVNNDSHTHDTRYYTETEVNAIIAKLKSDNSLI